MAIRAVRGYRTVSHGAACVIAGSMPWEKEAKVLADVYWHKEEKRAEGYRLAPQEILHAREQAREVAMCEWSQELQSNLYGRWTIDAIRPVLKEWVHREHGALTFRLVQVLSGHGCFGRYLHRVARREVSMACQHCVAPEDTAQHTLQECSAWEPQRQSLKAVVGQDLTLTSVVYAMLSSERAWEAMVSFCENVILLKETAERIREDDPQAETLRRRRTGRRRRQFNHQLLLDGGQPGLGAGSPIPALHRPLTPGNVTTQGHLPPPNRGDRRVRLRRAITDRAAVESDREPVTLSSNGATLNVSSDDDMFDDALALR